MYNREFSDALLGNCVDAISKAGGETKVVRVPGTHSLRSTAAVEAAVSGWLPGVVARATTREAV